MDTRVLNMSKLLKMVQDFVGGYEEEFKGMKEAM